MAGEKTTLQNGDRTLEQMTPGNVYSVNTRVQCDVAA